ncbi:hypothetical protein ACLOJK_023980 [Asimina triloba]
MAVAASGGGDSGVAGAGSVGRRRQRRTGDDSVANGGRLTEVVMAETMDDLDPLIQALLMMRKWQQQASGDSTAG